MAKTAGQVISGSFGSIVVRQKSDSRLEIGQLLTAETGQGRVLMQVFDLVYGSQLSQQSLEMISGMKLESENDLELMDAELRNYTLAFLKPLLTLEGGKLKVCKTLPDFFSSAREVDASDTSFLEKPDSPLLVGNLRSGSRVLDSGVFINGEKALSHHILIAAQTGRGKSNLMSCLLLSALQEDYAGFLILDPHDEYYGRNKLGLRQASEKVVYYTPNAPPSGARTLCINIRRIKPSNFNGVVFWSDAQKEALYAYYRKYGAGWIEATLLKDDGELKSLFSESTTSVIKRRLMQILNLEVSDSQIYPKGIFDTQSGISTVSDVADDLEKTKAVIIDTSSLSSQTEILIGSILASEVFSRYQNYKAEGQLKDKPVISVILEEAPRVLGQDALEKGPNIFSRIAREGRKFKVGLTAITQLPSVIPRQILANIGTKIILGIEMAPERKAIIESSAQDLSRDDRAIASLDIGEAIVTSTFLKFAIPVKVPFFEELIKKRPEENYAANYPGLSQ